MVDTALITRLDISTGAINRQDAERRVKIAHQNTLPTVNALANYEYGHADGQCRLGIETLCCAAALSGARHRSEFNTLPERNPPCAPARSWSRLHAVLWISRKKNCAARSAVTGVACNWPAASMSWRKKASISPSSALKSK